MKFKNKKIQVHETWIEFLTPENKSCLKEIEKKIGENFTPDAENVLRFLGFDLASLKCVILGQDPYPQRDVATGRAFEVRDLKNWQDKERCNASLRNILRLIHKNELKRGHVCGIEEVRKAIQEEKFKILPPQSLFENWEKQGVLLLNTALTCEMKKPKSHVKYWLCFTKRVIDYVKDKSLEAKWLLWGGEAKKFASSPFESGHPSERCSPKKKDSFFDKNHFSLDLGINWLGEK